jgi:hypothetical protein
LLEEHHLLPKFPSLRRIFPSKKGYIQLCVGGVTFWMPRVGPGSQMGSFESELRAEIKIEKPYL